MRVNIHRCRTAQTFSLRARQDESRLWKQDPAMSGRIRIDRPGTWWMPCRSFHLLFSCPRVIRHEGNWYPYPIHRSASVSNLELDDDRKRRA